MPDASTTTTTAPQRIDVNAHYEVRDWAARFGVTPEQLREAVRAVGVWSDEVAEFLKASPQRV